MIIVTSVWTNKFAAEPLGYDLEMLEALTETDDNFVHRPIVSIDTGDDVSITVLTTGGIDKLREMFKDAPQA